MLPALTCKTIALGTHFAVPWPWERADWSGSHAIRHLLQISKEGGLTARHLNAFTGRRELAPAEQHVLGSAEPEQGFLQTVPVSSGAQEVWGKEGERLKCLRMERGDLLKTLAEAEVSKATKRQ